MTLKVAPPAPSPACSDVKQIDEMTAKAADSAPIVKFADRMEKLLRDLLVVAEKYGYITENNIAKGGYRDDDFDLDENALDWAR